MQVNIYIYILNLSEMIGSIFITVEHQLINTKQMTEKNNNFANTIIVIMDVSKIH